MREESPRPRGAGSALSSNGQDASLSYVCKPSRSSTGLNRRVLGSTSSSKGKNLKQMTGSATILRAGSNVPAPFTVPPVRRFPAPAPLGPTEPAPEPASAAAPPHAALADQSSRRPSGTRSVARSHLKRRASQRGPMGGCARLPASPRANGDARGREAGRRQHRPAHARVARVVRLARRGGRPAERGARSPVPAEVPWVWGESPSCLTCGFPPRRSPRESGRGAAGRTRLGVGAVGLWGVARADGRSLAASARAPRTTGLSRAKHR